MLSDCNQPVGTFSFLSVDVDAEVSSSSFCSSMIPTAANAWEAFKLSLSPLIAINIA